MTDETAMLLFRQVAEQGLPSQRERIATAALQGLLANETLVFQPIDYIPEAIQYADALIAALEGAEK